MITKRFDDRFELVDQGLTELFRLVCSGLRSVDEAVASGDRTRAISVAGGDADLDALFHQVEAMVQEVILLQSPVATDLRYLLSALRIAPELQRSGDLVQHIASRVSRGTARDLPGRLQTALAAMSRETMELWASASEIFRTHDLTEAELLRIRDDRLDDLYSAAMAEIADAELPVMHSIDLAQIARFYERLGDHAVNIAHRVRFIAAGLSSGDVYEPVPDA